MKSIKKPVQFIVLLLGLALQAQHSGGGEANPELSTNKEALQKFLDMRFGMFIHWGPVALRGTEISWSRGRDVPIEDYDNLYKEFNPMLFNAADWVKAAKDAGMKYIVLTARHHDGFSLWDSKHSDYDMASTPYGRGIINELVEECKKQDIVFGTYYSICDWRHEDYPVVYPSEDYSFHEEKEITDPETKRRMNDYIAFMKNQLRELIENYDPAFIWFDGEWEWAWSHEMGMDMYKYLRSLKDDLLINNRVDKGREGMSGTTKSNKFAGDYATPEQEVGNFDNKNAWETCMTIAEQWAWKPNDKMKSKKECIQTLLQTIGGDGNLLFNVGPMLDGRIEERQIDRLKEMGDWLNINGKAVYGTRGGPYLPTDHMVSTHKDSELYIHLFKKEGQELILPFPKEVSVNKAYFLDGATPLKIKQRKESVTISLPLNLPDEIASVIVLELNKPASEIDVIKRMNY